MIEVPDAVRQLVEGLADAAVVIDDHRRVLSFNRAYAALCATSDAELARRVAGGVRCDELFAPAPEGETHSVSVVPIVVGEDRFVVESCRGVTAQRRLRSQLLHVDKMTGLGRLVAGIAHELNNPINFIYGNVDFLGEYMRDLIRLIDLVDGSDLPDDVRARFDALKAQVEYEHVRDDWQKLVRSIRAGAERTAGIVRDLRTYSRASGAELREVDVVAQLDTTLTLITPLVRDRIQIRRSVESDVPHVVGNPGHIGQ